MKQKKHSYLLLLSPIMLFGACVPFQLDMLFLILSFMLSMLLKLYISVLRYRIARKIDDKYGCNASLDRGIFERKKIEKMLALQNDPLLSEVKQTNVLDMIFGLMLLESVALSTLMVCFF